MAKVKIYDNLTLKPIEVSKEIKDFYMMGEGGPSSIRVRIAATHSGRVTRNNGFYLPDRMRKGAETWVAQYPKPILAHHADHDDAIGRVVGAHYVDVSTGVRDQWQAKSVKDSVEPPISNTLLDAFMSGQLSFRESVDVARQ